MESVKAQILDYFGENDLQLQKKLHCEIDSCTGKKFFSVSDSSASVGSFNPIRVEKLSKFISHSPRTDRPIGISIIEDYLFHDVADRFKESFYRFNSKDNLPSLRFDELQAIRSNLLKQQLNCLNSKSVQLAMNVKKVLFNPRENQNEAPITPEVESVISTYGEVRQRRDLLRMVRMHSIAAIRAEITQLEADASYIRTNIIIVQHGIDISQNASQAPNQQLRPNQQLGPNQQLRKKYQKRLSYLQPHLQSLEAQVRHLEAQVRPMETELQYSPEMRDSTELKKDYSARFIEHMNKKFSVETQFIEGATYDAQHSLALCGVREKLNDEICEQAISYCSVCFYTSKGKGYKLQLKVMLNGCSGQDINGTEIRGRYVSVFVTVRPHLYDEQLEWPYKPKIYFSLENQMGGDDFCVEKDLQKCGGFLKPSGNYHEHDVMNLQWIGCETFCTKRQLFNDGFVEDDIGCSSFHTTALSVC